MEVRSSQKITSTVQFFTKITAFMIHLVVPAALMISFVLLYRGITLNF